MQTASHVPATGEVFLDARGGSRALRVSWHSEAGVVVLSLWRDGTCAGTFRLTIDEVPDLIDVLRAGLAQAYDGARASFIPGMQEADHLAG
ncbi:MAG TPA: hypothetical protein VJ819_08415 [Nocardioidaceae bacterium]|nr:hypothetical protein [Nocardioidaceae bacterium]